mmetsp:Transcript_73672/g.146502  ORF Transcript_73672/g.146502 Transcript_73672/m.146502 type:complete len:324 (-) Transcript_73672:367-1338(-)
MRYGEASTTSAGQIALLDQLDVCRDHLPAQLRHGDLGDPSELLLRFGRVANQQLHFRRSEVLRIDPDVHLVRLGVDTLLIDPLALPLDSDADAFERELDERTNRVRLARRHHEIIGSFLLKHHPHHLHIVACMPPIAFGIDVAHVEAILHAQLYASDGARHFARDEGGAAPRRLVVEEDAVGCMHAVCFAVVDDDPIGVLFGDRIRRARIKGRCLLLWHLLHETIELGGGGLVEARLANEAGRADRVEQPQHAHPISVGCVLGHFKRDLHVRLCPKVVELVGAHLGDDIKAVSRVGEVTIVKNQPPRIDVRVFIKIFYAPGVE